MLRDEDVMALYTSTKAPAIGSAPGGVRSRRDLDQDQKPGPTSSKCSLHGPLEAQEGGEQRTEQEGKSLYRGCHEHQEDLLGKDRQAQDIKGMSVGSGKQGV